MLKMLRKIYLSVHALNWLEITPDDPRRQTKEWEQWPGRCKICHRYEFPLQQKYQKLIRGAKENEGIFFLPSGMKGDIPLIELARKQFGPRCVVCGLVYELDYNRQTLGSDFVKALEEDKQKAIKNRGHNLTEREFIAWELSKAWAIYLKKQLELQGYTYDPATVKFVAFGEDWCGCAATFPIHMSSALGLAKPIERRFDLINPDCSPVLLKAIPVEQNLPMPEHIRLFIFKTENSRYVAQYWEGMHSIIDMPHVVEVDFPPNSVEKINAYGERIDHKQYGRMVMGVGCGCHTPHHPTWIMTRQNCLAIKDLRDALLAGKVSEKKAEEIIVNPYSPRPPSGLL